MPQIDPMIPFDTPKGEGFAFWRTDYSQEHDTLYSVIITATREVWDIPQPQVRGVKNISMGRTQEPTPIKNLSVAAGVQRENREIERIRRTVDHSLSGDIRWENPNGGSIRVAYGANPNDLSTLVEGGPWRML